MAPKVNSQLMDIKGKAYLKVPGRVEAFREAHPAGAITTELVSMEPRIIVRAQIHGDDGVLIATGYGTAPQFGQGESTWRGKEIEKAETAAVGRALGFAGYGTLAAFADDDTDNLADSPVEPPRKPAPAPTPPTNGNGGHFDGLPEIVPTPEQEATASGKWTKAQADSFNLECKQNNVSTETALKLLGVTRLSQYGPGFSAAREQLRTYLKARPAPAAEKKEVIF